MSLAIPAVRYAGFTNNLAATPSTTAMATTVTASATPHVKGAYATLVASCPRDVYGITLSVSDVRVSATRTDMLLDLARGAAASERVVLPDLLVGWSPTSSEGGFVVFLPLFIPQGTRISARIQALISSDTANVAIWLNNGIDSVPPRTFCAAHAYGVTGASSIGTSHTPGASGVESTAANVGGTLSRDYGAILFQAQGTLADTNMSNAAQHWELMISSATRGEWRTETSGAERRIGPFPAIPLPMNLVSGTQLQVRAESSEASPEAMDVAFYCFY